MFLGYTAKGTTAIKEECGGGGINNTSPHLKCVCVGGGVGGCSTRKGGASPERSSQIKAVSGPPPLCLWCFRQTSVELVNVPAV